MMTSVFMHFFCSALGTMLISIFLQLNPIYAGASMFVIIIGWEVWQANRHRLDLTNRTMLNTTFDIIADIVGIVLGVALRFLA
jgi:hypothetical protein